MSNQAQSRGTIAVIGGGVIGRSWTAAFIANGYDVVISDPAEGIAESIREKLPADLHGIPGKSFSDAEIAALIDRVSFEPDIAKAVQGVVAVQENGPERNDFKAELFAKIEPLVGKDTLLLSSSSGITPDIIGAKMTDPHRVVIGHPFNPPHQLPLVEICGTPDADEALIARVMAFYRGLDKAPARLNRPVPGFVANRLQAVLVGEALSLVDSGVVDMKTLDEIMLNSLGPRWASIGPLLALHLGGGDGGLHRVLSQLYNHVVPSMGLDPLPDDSIDRLGKIAEETYPRSEAADYIALRDRRTIGMLESRE
ncbi:MAG TPA: 3-hydroxyacyl-CoA dehydrogenase NAD-binding domain-containing protein [Paracoccus sp. (in: a-proteobacteria)]|uniref:3-hydroxyacyl-CoA dehydrogenase family protein n=1 Tax=uncultured Paracoccus sp. TaxID=189685 RepID=UPI001DA96312|nr:3-hydroxyacyl-CoA dehydrogenase NAD-binding domain-containing protein [uncultured Paracoccus sp.]MCB1440805.1 hydroxylacyl-CoA dehydrogenase [Nitratireductor sp.]HMQ40139.1 3-hydroxyacyl-CoA dehydrogenase NAD-binding domain-containing protein [Paracoccus sp. (in: a-proteobacteria)]HMR35111.1 3-hydroxyacyl-CoA dehydrogenase NAD-binding domain-containing protein [Paracoccus sp. (in: a-proteobacteria)]